MQVDSNLRVQQMLLVFPSPESRLNRRITCPQKENFARVDEKKLTPFCLPESVAKAHDTFIVLEIGHALTTHTTPLPCNCDGIGIHR
jgi:hypothetical protein